MKSLEPIEVLRARPGWPEAIEQLRQLHRRRGETAAEEAATYADVYRGRRGAMVFDVVASRQRRYDRVRRLVEAFSDQPEASDLALLGSNGPGEGWGLRTGEADTMRNAAAGLVRYCTDHRLGTEEGVRSWADATASLAEVHRLDPYVGEVKGIGPALFAYLRMRAGGDGIKPDLRVRRALNQLGFNPPAGEAALLRIGVTAAAELNISLLELDQLLWSSQLSFDGNR